MTVRTRFAPSPTGYMHLGNLRTALYTYLYARKTGGVFMLRIEDTDQEREVAGAIDIIFKSLKTVGLDWDEGPDKGGPVGPYIQSERKHTYRPFAEELVDKGGAYYCFCTEERLDKARAEAEARGETFKYDKCCLHLHPAEAKRRAQAGEPHVIRQNIPLTGKASFEDIRFGTITVDCDQLDDNVLIKSDGFPTYNFANVIDDHTMGVTHVIRGTEYLSSTPKYNLLYQSFGWTPPVYIHVQPVMRDASHKLSKRHGDPSFEDLIARGFLKDAIINYIALLGWSPGDDREFFTLPEMVEAFSLKGLSMSPSIFDEAKLTWFNADYIRRLSPEDYAALANPWLDKALGEGRFDRALLCKLLQGRTEVFERLPGMVDFLAEMPAFDPVLYVHKKMKTDAAVAKAALEAAIPALSALADWSEAAIHGALMALPEASGLKTGQLLWPLRVAISGRESTPGGAIEIAYLLGREETLLRASAAHAAL